MFSECYILTFPEHFPVTFPEFNFLKFPERYFLTFPEHNFLTFPECFLVMFPERHFVKFPEHFPVIHRTLFHIGTRYRQVFKLYLYLVWKKGYRCIPRYIVPRTLFGNVPRMLFPNVPRTLFRNVPRRLQQSNSTMISLKKIICWVNIKS